MKNINAKHFNTRLINQIGEQMEVKSQHKDKEDPRFEAWVVKTTISIGNMRGAALGER